MVFEIRVGRSGFFFSTYKYAPSSKITQTCLFLSYYSLSIIWHAVQCFWFQTSIKCTRKWRKLLKSETEMNFRILSIYSFFGMKNVRVGGKILGPIGNTHIFFLALNTNQLITEKGPTYDIFSTRFVICHLACLE